MQEKIQTNLAIDPVVLTNIYRQMARIRATDKAIQTGLMSGRFFFTYWPMTGQEAIPAVVSQLTTTRDYMVTTYRGIHDQVAKGVDLFKLFAEAMGRIANGLAFAAQSRGEDRVTIVNFGDGATSIGAVHEAMNLAGAWKLPVIFMCQNNQIAEYTFIPDYTASPDFAGRAAGYGFTGVKLDSRDPISFYNGMKKVIEQIRAGNGPVFVEAITHRHGPHAGVGDSKDITAEALAIAKEEWPVPRTRTLLLDAGICTEAELEEMEAAAAAEVEDAIVRALACKVTPVEETLLDVYADPTVPPQPGIYPVRAEEAAPTGETKVMLMAEAIGDAQRTALLKDPEVFLLGEDIGDPPGGVFATSRGLQTEFGKRVRPTPIAEQAIIGAGTGAAIAGMRPIAEIMFNDFAGVCMDQIFNHAAKQRYMSGGATHVPLTIRMIVGGGLGGTGAQHSQSLEAWLLHTPGLKVVYPSTPFDAKGLLLSCIFDEDPCIHLEPMALLRSLKGEVPIDDYRIPLGVAKIRRPGMDITLITYGWQVAQCLKAAEELAKEDISAEVIDLRSLVPLDYHRVLDSVKKTRRALVVHAATEFCGFGGEIASTINEELFTTLKAPATRFGAAFAPIAYSREIETNQIPNAGSIAARVRKIIAS